MGSSNIALARAAITSWDSDYGYEFIDRGHDTHFSRNSRPQLARAQQHAVIVARDRLMQLAQAAPSRFRGMGWVEAWLLPRATEMSAGEMVTAHPAATEPDRYATWRVAATGGATELPQEDSST